MPPAKLAHSRRQENPHKTQVKMQSSDFILTRWRSFCKRKDLQMTIIDFIPTGRANAITADELAARTGTSKRDVRKQILHARCNGEPICSSSESGNFGGYYLPANAEEAQVYYRQQTSRINSGMRALSAIERFIEERDTENE